MKKWLIGLACVGMMAVSAMEAMGGLIISQYYEGASNNKWIEIYNPGPGSVDLYAGGYRLGLWANVANREAWKTGAAPGGVMVLSNSIAAGATYLVKNTSAALPAYAVADLTSGSLTFNGDDSVVLYTGTTYAFANVVDAFGMTASNGVDKSFVRKSTVTTGVNTDFNAADWDEFSIAAVDAAAAGTPERLGYHSTGAAVFGVTFDQTSGFEMEEGTTDAILATAANGAAPYTYAWSSTLGGTHYATNGNEFSILATAPTGSYSATVVATDNTAQTVTNSLDFSVVAAALKYGITITPPVNGTVTTTPADEAAEGVTVTVNATPAGGHVVGTVTVVDEGMNPVTVTLPARTFTMPGSDVTVTVTFQEHTGSALFISEVADPSGTGGGDARFVEIYNAGAAPVDLAAGQWYLARQANAGSIANIALTGTVGVAETYVVSYNLTNYTAAYPAAPLPNQTSGNINGNGNDGYFLYSGGNSSNGVMQDAYGVLNQNGTGMPWEYEDARAERNADVSAGNPTWTAGEWTITDPAAAAAMTPGTHTAGPAVFGVALNRANGFTVDEGSSDAITATAANGTGPYGYAWSSTLGGAHYATNAGVFTILATAPTGSYTATVVATDAGAQSATNSVSFSVVAPAPNYAITITPPVNGTVTTTPATNAAAGVTVTINATPSGGYAVGTITVVDAGMNPVTVALPARTFVMPASAVTVAVDFTVSSDTATLPTSFSGPGWYQGTGLPNGWTQTGLGTDYATSLDEAGNSGKFDNSPNDTVQIKYDGAATAVSYWLQLNGTWTNSNIFKVQESVNGADWTDLAIYDDANPIPTTKAQYTNTPNAASRYIRFNYFFKGSGNVQLDGVAISGTAGPTLSYTGSTAGTVGQQMALTFTLNGGTASGWQWTLESATREEILTGSVNVFTWTPPFTGTFYLVMTALDEAVEPIATREVTLTVTAPNPGDPAVVIAGSLSGTVDQAMNLSITVTNATATDWFIDLKDPDGLDDFSYNFNTPPAFILTPTKVGTYTLVAVAETAGGNYTNTALLTVAGVATQPDIPPINFVPASGNFTFSVPAGYALNRVRGADTAVSGQAWVFSNLTLGVHYTVSGTNVTVLTVPQSRKIIQIGVNPAP